MNGIKIKKRAIKEKALEDLQTEFNAKRATILRQSIHAEPELIERAAERITMPFVLRRLNEYDSVKEAYDESGMIKAQIDEVNYPSLMTWACAKRMPSVHSTS